MYRIFYAKTPTSAPPHAISTTLGVNIDPALTPSPPYQIVASADAPPREAGCRTAESETFSLSDDGTARLSTDTLCSPAVIDPTTQAIISSNIDDALDSELSSTFGTAPTRTPVTCIGTGPQATWSLDITANGTLGPTGLDPRELARLHQSPQADALIQYVTAE